MKNERPTHWPSGGKEQKPNTSTVGSKTMDIRPPIKNRSGFASESRRMARPTMNKKMKNGMCTNIEKRAYRSYDITMSDGGRLLFSRYGLFLFEGLQRFGNIS
jgi:hypothetical protein